MGEAMTKDKTVTMSRELAERLAIKHAQGITDPCTIRTINAQFYAALDELRATLAAPIVEADGMGEAVAWRYKKSWRKDGWMLLSTKPDPMEVDPETNTIQPLFASQPDAVIPASVDLEGDGFYFAKASQPAPVSASAMLELAEAAKASLALNEKIKSYGRPPHSDFWHQSQCEAETRLQAAYDKVKELNP